MVSTGMTGKGTGMVQDKKNCIITRTCHTCRTLTRVRVYRTWVFHLRLTVHSFIHSLE